METAMKKSTKKLSLAKQSVKNLAEGELVQAGGAGQTDYHVSVCVTNCRASACVCTDSFRYC
jgi:hypothetical protein